jgi:chaperone modulatory protein CbpM
MLNPEEFCLRAGIERTTLELWLGEGWLVPLEANTALLLSDVDLARARLIRDLRDGMGVNDEGIGIILDLIDQVHGLRSILQGVVEHLRPAERAGSA